MTLQNRVRPDGKIVPEPWRGTLMGNRGGRIHDPGTKELTGRRWASRRWIYCHLQFKGRQRTVMGDSYTELFFLDEVSALAAGHRPCFECRRPDANRFADTWSKRFGPFEGSRADAMDNILHTERLAEDKPLADEEIADLPDGAMVEAGGLIFARKDNCWHRWSGEGYHREDLPEGSSVQLLTPPAVIELFREGYLPNWHESVH